MNVFAAGASGAIGIPLIAELLRQGHTITGMAQSEASANKLIAAGARAAIANAFDRASVEIAIRESRADVVIDQLTSLPKNPADMAVAQAGDTRLRLEGGANLQAAAQACGVHRFVQQSSGFFLLSLNGLADESSPLAVDASPSVSQSSRTYTQIEARTLESPIPGVVLRYGFFYGPNTWYFPDGGAADQVRRQQGPLIGRGNAIWSWVHIEDAALATVSALTAAPGIYDIVDDDPSPVRLWLPAFAKSVGAPPPPQITEAAAHQTAGEDAVYYGTKLSGASNAKAKRDLNFSPRRLEWLSS